MLLANTEEVCSVLQEATTNDQILFWPKAQRAKGEKTENRKQSQEDYKRAATPGGSRHDKGACKDDTPRTSRRRAFLGTWTRTRSRSLCGLVTGLRSASWRSAVLRSVGLQHLSLLYIAFSFFLSPSFKSTPSRLDSLVDL